MMRGKCLGPAGDYNIRRSVYRLDIPIGHSHLAPNASRRHSARGRAVLFLKRGHRCASEQQSDEWVQVAPCAAVELLTKAPVYKLASSRGAPTSTGVLARAEVRLGPRVQDHLSRLGDGDVRESERERRRATDHHAGVVVLRAVARADILVACGVPGDDASKVRAHGVDRVGLDLLVGGHDQVGRVALKALDEFAVASRVRREPLLHRHIIAKRVTRHDATARAAAARGEEEVCKSTRKPEARHRRHSDEEQVHNVAALHVGDEVVTGGGGHGGRSAAGDRRVLHRRDARGEARGRREGAREDEGAKHVCWRQQQRSPVGRDMMGWGAGRVGAVRVSAVSEPAVDRPGPPGALPTADADSSPQQEAR
eukprot:CAMPEP_0179843664 /NCGR_PEP_ID=MMETSP0982-20121206/3846_1 /TAXON_ID=483367 /ORGANISM="non described non described, Strain CCMP 2436" /LENGTH=366 /DNA_ID=CAMNT_0021728149 /DNA_START=74 /DNA_END=1175 /DNA_ORIENTATION=+